MDKFRRQVWIKTNRGADEVMDPPQRLNSGETGPDHHEGEQRLALASRALRVRFLQMRDQAVPQFDRVVEGLDSQSCVLDSRYAEEVRARTERDYQMVVTK